MSDENSSIVEPLEVVEATTGENPSASVIWLHGLGADGHDFEPIVPDLKLPGGPDLRFVFPHAPVRPVTINAGYPMRAWYDIRSIDRSAPSDIDGIKSSMAGVRSLIENEVSRGVATDRIILAGFSQGGGIALNTALRYPKPLAGVIGLSTWVPGIDDLEAECDSANGSTPLFLAHGSLDPMVPEAHGRDSADKLEAMGYPVTWNSYPMMHSVCPEEIIAVRDWLVARLGSGAN
ncbi:MAG: alpha/beta hydrolase [Gammaproteobacteria bacterium]